MFGKKKSSAPQPPRRKGADLMNQMGFGGMPGMSEMDPMLYGDDDDDDELEAELAELAGEDYKLVKAKAKRKAHVPLADIEQMAAAGLEDVDEDVSDTEDPSLLAELEDLQDDDDEPVPQKPSPPPNSATVPSPSKSQAPSVYQTTPKPPAPSPKAPAPSPKPPTFNQPTPFVNTTPSPAPRATPSPASTPSPAPKPSGAGGMPGLIEERINMYKQALDNAKAAGDSSKQRRLNRGLKTLAGLLRQAKAGKPVNEDDIPPPVAIGAGPSSSAATAPAPTPPSQTHQETQPERPTVETARVPSSSGGGQSKDLVERRDQYKKAALMAKRGGDLPKAGSYVKIARQFDNVIEALERGQPVDLSKMPPPPPEFSGNAVSTSKNVPSPTVPVERSANQAAGSKESQEPEMEFPEITEAERKRLFKAPDTPTTVMEALTQRLAKYQSSADDAKKTGEGSKARRMGRIVKQYEDAIKSYKAGRPVDFDELPTPPGFGPIPVESTPAQPNRSQAPPTPVKGPAAVSPPAPAQRPEAAVQRGPQASQTGPSTSTAVAPSSKQPVQRQNTAKKITTRAEQQLAFLNERSAEFKEAAIAAKKNHDIELAKKYVRIMKGLEPMIEASQCGLPVDLSQVPESPYKEENEDKFVIVNAEDCEPTGDREEVFKNLQQDLIKQIQICVTNAQHYQKLGDVPAAAKFQKLEQGSRKDLESLKSSYRHGDPAPRFHYEVRTFSMVKSNTDLGDADMEVSIIRGIQYNLPSGYSEKDMDTCVKYEMAYPSDESQTGGTGTVKDTVNPEYKESFKLQINRSSKSFTRFVERKGLKFEIFLKRGFFKGDKLLGTVNIKLNPLERQCTLHESYDLMEGRKSAGGKLEIKMRIRDPLKSKQVDEVKEKWLVIDQFIRTVGSKSQAGAKGSKAESGGTLCMEVLRMEKQLLDKQISQLKDSLNVNQTHSLKQKSSLLQEKIDLQQKKLREGGIEAWKVSKVKALQQELKGMAWCLKCSEEDQAYMEGVSREVISFEQEARQYIKLGEVQKAELLMNKKKHAEKELAAIKARMPAS